MKSMFDERLLIIQNVITNSDIILKIENLLKSDRNKSVKNRFEYSIVTQNDDFDDIMNTRNHDSIFNDDVMIKTHKNFKNQTIQTVKLM